MPIFQIIKQAIWEIAIITWLSALVSIASTKDWEMHLQK